MSKQRESGPSLENVEKILRGRGCTDVNIYEWLDPFDSAQQITITTDIDVPLSTKNFIQTILYNAYAPRPVRITYRNTKTGTKWQSLNKPRGELGTPVTINIANGEILDAEQAKDRLRETISSTSAGTTLTIDKLQKAKEQLEKLDKLYKSGKVYSPPRPMKFTKNSPSYVEFWRNYQVEVEKEIIGSFAIEQPKPKKETKPHRRIIDLGDDDGTKED